MKKLILTTIVILGIALIGQPSTASANVLTNPGFESGLAGWFSVGDHAIYTAGWAAQSGALGGAINAAGTGTGMLLQEITGVGVGDKVDLSGWTSGSGDLVGTVSMAIEFWNGGVQLGGGSTFSKAGAYAYKLDSISAFAPALTTKAKIVLGSAGTAGVSMFDNLDATVTPIPEPASLLLLGSGLVGLFTTIRKKSVK